MKRIPSLLVAALMLVSATAAHAVRPATLVDPKLNRVEVGFISLGQGKLSYFDADRKLTSAVLAKNLALRFDRDRKAASASPGIKHTLRLRDGTIYRGSMLGVDKRGLIWQTETLGKVTGNSIISPNLMINAIQGQNS